MADFENIAKQFCEAYYNLFSTNRDVSPFHQSKFNSYLLYRTSCNYSQRTPCLLLKESSSLDSNQYIINWPALTRFHTRLIPSTLSHLLMRVLLQLSLALYKLMMDKTWCSLRYSIYKREDSKAITSSTTFLDWTLHE